MEKVKGLGECFNKTADYALDHWDESDDVKIIHGLIIGQGPIEGILHGHAWLQKGDQVIDLENNISLDVSTYEALAQIKYKKEYTIKEALKAMSEAGHKGPWDRKILEVNYAAFDKLVKEK